MKSFSLYTLITLVALGGLNPAVGSSTDIRDYRRAALAIGGRLPTPAEIENILAGRLAYPTFVEQLLRSSGFEERMVEHLWMRFMNSNLSDTDIARLTVSDYALKSNMRPGVDLGGGIVARPRDGYAPKPYPAYTAFVPDPGPLGNSNFEYLEICSSPSQCVVEAPLKALAAAAARRQCSLNSEYYGPGGNRSQVFPTDVPVSAPDCATQETRLALGLHYKYPFVHWGYFGDELFPRISGVQLQPGYYSGCVLPGQTAQTIPANAVDSVNAPLRADALRAVEIRPWWDPSTPIYACPGVALDAAFASISTITSPIGTFRAPNTYVAGQNAYTIGQGARACTAYAFDTALNPHCDCGPQFQNCIMVRQLISKSINYQALAAFKHILSTGLPYRSLLDGSFRPTNRVLEWLDLVTGRDPLHYARASSDPSIPGPSIFTGSIRNSRIIGYSGPRHDFSSALQSLPSMRQEYWLKNQFNYGWGFGDLASQEYRTTRLEPGWDTSFRMRPSSSDPNEFRHSGILSTYSLTFAIPSLRARSARLTAFFRCTDFGKLASIGGSPLPGQQSAPLHQRNECKSCHSIIEPLSAFFSGTWGRDNTNFSSLSPVIDGVVAANPSFHRSAQFGFGEVFMPTRVIANKVQQLQTQPIPGAAPPSGHHGLDPVTGQPFEISDLSSTQELPGLARYLTEPSVFNACSIRRIWEALMGRAPTEVEARELTTLSAGLTGRDYSIQDFALAIALSDVFRKGVTR
jgi:hypothetical protein